LEEIVDLIDKEDPDALEELLKGGSPHVNDYLEIEDLVLITPLLYAIKLKNPECVDILVYAGADPELSFKVWDPDYPDDESKQKSLNTNALAYAMGEKKKAVDSTDIGIYETIIKIIKEPIVNREIIQQKQSSQKEEHSTTALPESSSASITVETHRIAQKTMQNQLDIKNLQKENESLKKEIKHLRKELNRFQPWIERWMNQDGIISPNLEKKTIMENEIDNGGSGMEDPKDTSEISEPKKSDRSPPKSKDVDRTKKTGLMKNKSSNSVKSASDSSVKRGADSTRRDKKKESIEGRLC